jgi:hypothetical protein
MSEQTLVGLGVLVIVVGCVSIAAAAMGNPIKIGRKRLPGPGDPIERTAIAMIGAICLATVITAFIADAIRDRTATQTSPAPIGTTSSPRPGMS